MATVPWGPSPADKDWLLPAPGQRPPGPACLGWEEASRGRCSLDAVGSGWLLDRRSRHPPFLSATSCSAVSQGDCQALGRGQGAVPSASK